MFVYSILLQFKQLYKRVHGDISCSTRDVILFYKCLSALHVSECHFLCDIQTMTTRGVILFRNMSVNRELWGSTFHTI